MKYKPKISGKSTFAIIRQQLRLQFIEGLPEIYLHLWGIIRVLFKNYTQQKRETAYTDTQRLPMWVL